MVGPRKLSAIPDGLTSFSCGQLARHLDWFPSGAATDSQPLRLALAKRHPDPLPPAQLADARHPLWHRQKEAVAHLITPLCGATYAPSAVAQKRTGRPMEAAKVLV